MPDLSITSVDPDSNAYPDIVGAPAVLSDADDTTSIRLSSAANGETHVGDDRGYGAYGYAEYVIHFDGPLPAGTAVTLNIRLRVLSRGGSPFQLRATLSDPVQAGGRVRLDRVGTDGDITDITAVIDDAWLTTNADSSGMPDFAYLTSGDYTYTSLVDALGPTPQIHLIDRAGTPFEVEIIHVSLTTGQPYRRIKPRDDARAGGAPRNFPPSKASRSGNRTSGGYL